MNDQSISPNKKVSNFSFDVLRLVSGTAIGQVVVILAMPLLTRLYAPEFFGLLSVFTGMTAVLTVFACMSYEYAIILPEEDADAANLLAVSVVFSVLFSLLIVPVIWIWGAEISQLLNVPTLVNYLWLLPMSTLLSGLFAALNFWSSRTKHFGRLSISKVIQSLAATLTKLGAGYLGYATGGTMVGANVGGQIIATSLLGIWIWRDNRAFFCRATNWQDMIDNIKRYYQFPVFYTGSNLVNTLSSMIPIFLFSYFFSPSIVGYYSLGVSALQAPMSLLGNSISQVFFQKVQETRQQGQLDSLVEKLFTFLIIIGLFPILMMTLIGRDLFVIIFGQDWAEAGIYTQILAVSLALFFVTSPLTVLTAALEKQKFALVTSAVLLVLRVISLVIGGMQGNARLGVFLFSLTGVMIYGYRMFALNKFAGIPHQKTAKIALLGIVPFVATVLFFRALAPYQSLLAPWMVVMTGSVCVGVYALYIFLTKKDMLYLFLSKSK